MRFAYDADGVCVQPLAVVIPRVNKLLGDNGFPGIEYRERDIRTWGYLQGAVLEKTRREDLAKTAEDYWYDAAVLGAAPAMPLARIVVRLVDRLGIEQIVVSSRDFEKDARMVAMTVGWYRRHMPTIAREGRIRMRQHPSDLTGAAFKARELFSLQPSLYVEDDVNTLAVLRSEEKNFPKTRLALMTQPWNLDYHEWDGIRINWLGILAFAISSRLRQF